MRILLVEDHLDTLSVIKRLLTLRGHLITTATTLAEARHECGLGGFELLLCDIGLPDGNGWELGELARECGIKAIAMTGFGMADDIEQSAKRGFLMHLVKPIKFDELDRALETCA